MTHDPQGILCLWHSQYFAKFLPLSKSASTYSKNSGKNKVEFRSQPISTFVYISAQSTICKTLHHIEFVNKHLEIIWGHFRALLQTFFFQAFSSPPPPRPL
jgi:hypothetical protein